MLIAVMLDKYLQFYVVLLPCHHAALIESTARIDFEFVRGWVDTSQGASLKQILIPTYVHETFGIVHPTKTQGLR